MLGNQITQVRLPSGKVVSLVDWTDKPLWSTADLLSGFTDQEIDLFTYLVSDPVSSSGNITVTQTATERDTNISTPASMASTEEMLVYAIKPELFAFHVTGTDATTLAVDEAGLSNLQPQITKMLQHDLLLRLIISQKVYAEAGLGYFNTGFGVAASGGGGLLLAEGAVFFGAQGIPSQEATRAFVIPHHIGGQEKYRVQLANPGGGAVTFTTALGADDGDIMVRVRVYLDGLYKRPVS